MPVVIAPEVRSNNLKVVAGEMALDGSNPTPLDLSGYLKSIVAVVVGNKGADAPAGDEQVTYNVSGTTINFYAWTNAGAGSTITETFSYIVIGY